MSLLDAALEADSNHDAVHTGPPEGGGTPQLVLLSAYACRPGHGSEEGSGWNWAINLARSGRRVHVLTAVDNRERIEAETSADPVEGLAFSYVDDALRLGRRPIRRFSLDWYVRYLVWQHRALAEARRLDAVEPFDVVHHVSWGSLQLGSLLWKIGRPMVFGPVGGGQQTSVRFKSLFGPGWKEERIRSVLSNGPLFRWLATGRAAARADLVIVTNEETLELARRYGARDIVMMLDSSLEPGYLERHGARRAGDGIRALWVGRLGRRKGVDLFLGAMPHVASPDVEFRIVGGAGWLVPRVTEFVESGVEPRLTWTGQIPWDRVAEEYKAADLFVFTSLRDSFGSQVLEAAANGLPIVALDQFGVRDFVPDEAAIKVPLGDRDIDELCLEIAEAIDRIATDEDLRARMSEAAFAFAARNTWPDRISAIEGYYERAIAEHGAGSRREPAAVAGVHE